VAGPSLRSARPDDLDKASHPAPGILEGSRFGRRQTRQFCTPPSIGWSAKDVGFRVTDLVPSRCVSLMPMIQEMRAGTSISVFPATIAIRTRSTTSHHGE
jgi:hypothetical protein